MTILHFFPNKKSNITVNGNIVGKSFILSSFGGRTHFNGFINVHRLYVANSVVHLKTEDPKAFLSYLNQFVKNGNALLNQYGVTTKFPKHIWYAQGDLGRKIRCSVRGCYVQEFVNSYARASEPLPYWRYVLSIIGCIILVLGTILSPRLAKFIRFS